MARSTKQYWTAALTKFCQEQRAAYHIERQGFRYYLPEISSLTASGREKRELLFPGYIFIRVKAGWHTLMNTRGIARLFICGETPTRIPDNEIYFFKALEDDDGSVQLDPPLLSGSTVFGNEHAGSFCGVKGVVKNMTARHRVSVLLELLGKNVEVELDSRALTLAV